MSNMNIDIEGEMIIDKKDVICDVKKSKTGDWGHNPDEFYYYIVYWHKGRIWITVNGFYPYNDRYHCERSYSRIIGDKIEDFENMTEAEITSEAYGAWCDGAR
jgi:hypothetical protein